MTVHIDRLGRRLLRCGLCRQRRRGVYDICQERTWRDLSMRKLPLRLLYRPRRVDCPRCGVRVEDFPWAEPWCRVTTALAHAVAVLARELSWQATARHYGFELEERSHDREAGGRVWSAGLSSTVTLFGILACAQPARPAISATEATKAAAAPSAALSAERLKRLDRFLQSNKKAESRRYFTSQEQGRPL